MNLSEDQIRIVENGFESYNSTEQDTIYKNIKNTSKKTFKFDQEKYNYSNTTPTSYFTRWFHFEIKKECLKWKSSDNGLNYVELWNSFDRFQKNYMNEVLDLPSKYKFVVSFDNH